MTGDELPDREIEHVFTPEDRRHQISTLARLCDRIATILVDHGERFAWQPFRDRANYAERILSDGFSRADLNSLSGEFPSGPWWLNPKAADFNAPREAWQEVVAALYREASEVAMNLRAVATLK